jgi:ADP-heptose:LPS heptosyltransferase
MYLLKAPVDKFGLLPAKSPLITEEVQFTNNIAYCPKYFWKKWHVLQGCVDVTPDWMKKMRQERELFNILFIATGGFGDIMWYMPFMKACRLKYPRARILVATDERAMPLFAGVPYADMCVRDEFWNLQALIRNSHEVYDFGGIATMLQREMNLDPIDATFLDGELPRPKDRKDCRPMLVLTVDEGKQAEALLRRHGVDPWKDKIITIGLESSTPNRNWPHSYAKELTERLIAAGNKVIWLSESKDFGDSYFYECSCGTPFDFATKTPPERLDWICPKCHAINSVDKIEPPAGVVNLGGKTTIRQALSVLALSNVFVGPNSGLMVAATALETPTVGLFGAFDPKIRCKYYDKFVYVWGRPNCSPCKEHWTECRLGYPAPCMRLVKVDDVEKQINGLMARYPKTSEERRPIV